MNKTLNEDPPPSTGRDNRTLDAWTMERETISVVICVTGILGNLRILAPIFPKKRRRTVVDSITTNLTLFNVLCGLLQTTKSFSIIGKKWALNKQLCDIFGPIIVPWLTGCLSNYFLLALYYILETFKKTIFDRLFTRAKTAILIACTWVLVIASSAFVRLLAVENKSTCLVARCHVKHKYLTGLSSFYLLIIFLIGYANWRIHKAVHRWLPRIGDNATRDWLTTERTRHRLLTGNQIATIWLGVTSTCVAIGHPLSKLAPQQFRIKMWSVLYLLLLTNQLINPVQMMINECRCRILGRTRRKVGIQNVPQGMKRIRVKRVARLHQRGTVPKK